MLKSFKYLSVFCIFALCSACAKAPILPLDDDELPSVPDIAKMVERTLTQMTESNLFQNKETKTPIYLVSVTSFADINTINLQAIKQQISQRISLSPNLTLAENQNEKNLKYELYAEFYITVKDVNPIYDYRELIFKLKLYDTNKHKVTEWSELLKLNRIEGAWE